MGIDIAGPAAHLFPVAGVLVAGVAVVGPAVRLAAADSAVLVQAAEVLAAAALARTGKKMRTHRFLKRLDHQRIVQAIKKAEGRTSGQIRVFIQRGQFDDDALGRAMKKFVQLGMHKTDDRNAVLIFVAPRAHRFAVVGDVGVHEKCGDEFWQTLVDAMRTHFQKEDFSRGIVHGINEAAKVLAEHFPRTRDTINELPDEVVQE